MSWLTTINSYLQLKWFPLNRHDFQCFQVALIYWATPSTIFNEILLFCKRFVKKCRLYYRWGQTRQPTILTYLSSCFQPHTKLSSKPYFSGAQFPPGWCFRAGIISAMEALIVTNSRELNLVPRGVGLAIEDKNSGCISDQLF